MGKEELWIAHTSRSTAAYRSCDHAVSFPLSFPSLLFPPVFFTFLGFIDLLHCPS